MTIRNFDSLLSPRSVVLVGASDKPGSLGSIVARNLLRGGFQGSLHFVNPRRPVIEDRRSFVRIADLPDVPDLGVVVTPPAVVPAVIAELAAKGTRAAVVLTAGIRGELRQRMLDASREACLRIQGPNCLGLMLPRIGLDATFSHRAALPGDIAFVSQSGALVTGIVDWAASRGVGFSHVLSLGDMADVDFGDVLDYLAGDVSSRAILLYMESLTSAAKFMSAARRAARAKPVIAIKAGRHAAGAKAAFSHTGALAGSDRAYDAAFRRAGVLRVLELEELFQAAETISRLPRLDGERLAILTNGGGAGVLAADRLADLGGTLATLDPALARTLDAVLPPTWSRSNPVDIIGDAGAERYAAALGPLLEDAASDAVLVISCPTALVDSERVAEEVTRSVSAHRNAAGRTKPVLTCWLGDEGAMPARRRFAASGIPSYRTPASAIQGFMQLVRHARAQDELMRSPPAMPADIGPPDAATASRIIADALAQGRGALSEPEAKTVLAAYGIPVAETRLARGADEAAAHAADLLRRHESVVLKIVSEDISHKSDVGGVRLALATTDAVRAAAVEMTARISQALPKARLGGFAVQPMIRKPRAHELIVGVTEDPTFGPLVLFGAGGTAVEVLDDTATALPPLDIKLARDMLATTRVSRLLAGYRDRPRADLDAIALAVVRVSMLVTAHPEIRELDINPLLADEAGVVALDARVRVADQRAVPRRPMAVRPYPAQWEKTVVLAGLGHVQVRPIRPEDERHYEAFLSRVTPDDIRMRLLAPVRQLSHKLVARLTQIDYAREIAFVALSADGADLLGVARFHADPDYERAEYAVLVRSDLKGLGLGWSLMQHLIAYARAEGLRQLYGTVLAENTTMLAMCRDLGFRIDHDPEDAALRQVVLQL